MLWGMADEAPISVAFRGVTKRFGELEVLRGIDLSVAAGETVSLVGPSGSGKSSMMMLIAGLERPSAGRVAVGGVDFGGLDEDALARFRRDRVGIVFQDFHLILFSPEVSAAGRGSSKSTAPPPRSR